MSYSNGLLSNQPYQTVNKYEQRGLPGIGFKLTDTGDYDMQNKKLVNVKNGANGVDAVNKAQLDYTTTLLDGSRAGDVVNDKAVIYSNTGAVHARSLYLLDDPQDGNSNEVRIETPHQSYGNIHLNVPDLKNFDGRGGRPKSEVMVTSVKQIMTGKKIFENIEVHDPVNNNQAANKGYVDTKILNIPVLDTSPFLKKIGGTMTGDIILPKHDYPITGNTNKVINYEALREIFLSRKESFPMDTDINMNNNFIQNVKDPFNADDGVNKNYVDNQMGTKADLSKTTTQTFQGRVQVPNFNSISHNGADIVNLQYINNLFLNKKTGGTMNYPISFLSSLPNNQKQIHNIGSPQFTSSATNKQYVDTEITKVHQNLDLSPFLKIDGTRAMTGNLDMDNYLINKVGEPVNSDDVATKNYVDTEVGFITTPFLKIDGTRAMTGILNMDDHKIRNLKIPEYNTDATNKQYIDEELLKSHLISSRIENAFKYLMEIDESSSERNIDVLGIIEYNNSPHKNKKAYKIEMIYTSGTQNYDSKIGINLYPLPVGKFTIIMEYYFPEDTNISLLAEATTAIINKQTTTNFPNYKKHLVQINQLTKDTPDYLFFTIRGSGSTVTNPEGYLVFYGVKEWVDEVPSEIYDHAFETGMFEYDNGNMKMYHDIDMDNHRIKNLPPPLNPTDLLMKQSLEIHPILLHGTVRSDNHFAINGPDLFFKNPYISYIILFTGGKFPGAADSLVIIHAIGGIPRIMRFNFSHPPSAESFTFTTLNINKLIKGSVTSILTSIAKNIPFRLAYLPITFKS